MTSLHLHFPNREADSENLTANDRSSFRLEEFAQSPVQQN